LHGHTLLGNSLANVVVVRTDGEPGTAATAPHGERPSTIIFYDCTSDASLICVKDGI